jgi:hypothetical protein
MERFWLTWSFYAALFLISGAVICFQIRQKSEGVKIWSKRGFNTFALFIRIYHLFSGIYPKNIKELLYICRHINVFHGRIKKFSH